MRSMKESEPQRQKVGLWFPGPGEGEDFVFNGVRVSALQDENALETDGGMAVPHYECT